MAYLHNNKDQFQDAIELAYEQTGIMAQAIEKDYYVTMLLRLLSEKMPYIVFKGGTSLSKCHKVIKRFSEDIDITIDTQISQGKKKKIKQAIVSSADELGMNIENLEDEYRKIFQDARYKLDHEVELMDFYKSYPEYRDKPLTRTDIYNMKRYKMASQQLALRIGTLAIRIFQHGQLSICTFQNCSCTVAHMYPPEITDRNL